MLPAWRERDPLDVLCEFCSHVDNARVENGPQVLHSGNDKLTADELSRFADRNANEMS